MKHITMFFSPFEEGSEETRRSQNLRAQTAGHSAIRQSRILRKICGLRDLLHRFSDNAAAMIDPMETLCRIGHRRVLNLDQP